MYVVKLDANGSLQWSRTVGGTNWDYANSIIQTTDGGYAVAGWTSAGAFYDFYIVKLDGSGTLQWTRTLGGTNDDRANCIIQTTDGGYVAAGYTQSFGLGNGDIYIVKLDASGMFQWNRTIGGTSDDYANSIIKTTDGGFAVAGYTWSFGAGYYDLYILKLDESGNLQWSKTVGGIRGERASSIIQTTDGGYAVAGSTPNTSDTSGNNYDFYIVKLDAGGTLQWTRTVGGTNDNRANSIIQTIDGGYAVAGYTNNPVTGNPDFFIVKLDGSGTFQLSKRVGGASSDVANSIIRTTDGGYAVAGNTFSFGAGNYDFYIVKFDSSWNTCGNTFTTSPASGTYGTLGSPTSFTSSPTPTVTSPTPTANTGGTVTSTCPSPPVLYSPPNFSAGQPLSLNLVWYRVPTALFYRVQLTLASDPSFISPLVNDSTITDSLRFVGGLTNNTTYFWRVNARNAGGTGPWSAVWRFTTLFMGIVQISSDIPKDFSLSQNYPNPFNPVTKFRFAIPSIVKSEMSKVKLIIYGILGREVETLVNQQLNAGTYEVDWDGTNYPSGVYFYEFSARQAGSSTGDPSSPRQQAGKLLRITKKMVLLK